MFGYEDRRTAQERQRDLDACDKRRADSLLARGLLNNVVRPLLKQNGAEVGLVGEGRYMGADLLVEMDGVTYRLGVSVDNS